MPANLRYTLKNTGTVPLTAYVITETTPISTADQQWSRMVRPLFTANDGLATITRVETVTLDELTITRPFTGNLPNTEDLWMELSGTSIAFIGPYLRRQPPGVAYEHPPDNLAPTSNVNYSEDSQVKLLMVSTNGQ